MRAPNLPEVLKRREMRIEIKQFGETKVVRVRFLRSKEC
jgi:hypothetical protein